MHVQKVDLKQNTFICPECLVLQNVDVERHGEQVDLLAGQRCWYCGNELETPDVPEDEAFCVVVSGLEVPFEKDDITEWAHQLSLDYGAHLEDFYFDAAGRCLVTMKPTHTDADLDLAVD
jgi:hypothetical protein